MTAFIAPQVTSVTSIGNTLYLVGGRRLKSYTLSNSVIEINVLTFDVRVVEVSGTLPKPRHEHSVDAVGNRYLVLFGGLCYNSVGENDIFVYDTLKETWFMPNIQGYCPHLRFGHASAVIGTDLYIHGGAQIDSDSSYIVYDSLYKLDCKNWTWYKYEHPEVEQYLRKRPHTKRKDYVVPTTGDGPHDRFQSYMCASAGKLIVFGGRSIRMDSDDEIMYYYSLDELSIFHTKRHSWTFLYVKSDFDILMSNLSVATIAHLESSALNIIIFGQCVKETTMLLKEYLNLFKSLKFHDSMDHFRLVNDEFQEESVYSQDSNQETINSDQDLSSCAVIIELLE